MGAKKGKIKPEALEKPVEGGADQQIRAVLVFRS
jgi:hypothetical protein